MPSNPNCKTWVVNGETTGETGINGNLFLPNPHLASKHQVNLMHLGLNMSTDDLRKMFSDVKFVCTGGMGNRMKHLAETLQKDLGISLPVGATLCDLSCHANRYSMFKVGPVLTVNHGMGVPSLAILLNEIFKLLHFAGCSDVILLRIGTCGGIGIEPGTLVLTESAVDGLLQPYYELAILGRVVRRPAVLDFEIIQELKSIAEELPDCSVMIGKTLCAMDFYEGQARVDGAFCDYGIEDKLKYLEDLKKAGVLNIEMECLAFGAMCHRAGIRGAVLCLAIVDRLKSDEVSADSETMHRWMEKMFTVVVQFIQRKLNQQLS